MGSIKLLIEWEFHGESCAHPKGLEYLHFRSYLACQNTACS